MGSRRRTHNEDWLSPYSVLLWGWCNRPYQKFGDCSADFGDCYGTLMAKMCPEWWDWCMPNDALISCTPIDDKE